VRRWLPHPWMSVLLFAVWLLLVNDVRVASLIMAALLGVLLPVLTRHFWPERTRLRRPAVALHYLLRLLLDIVRANVGVAVRVLGPNRRLKPAFVSVPLELNNDLAVTLLASTVSLTPGTVSAEISADRRTLLVHCLDVDDAERLIDGIKGRYERPLKEMFP